MGSIHAVEEYELWWEKCLINRVSIDTFEGWLGNIYAPSRIAMRGHIKQKQYRSILDVPSGLCIDYFGFKQDGIEIAYQGVDITPKLVQLAQNQGLSVIEGDIKSLPFHDNQFDVCYARHILEHLDSYEKAITSLIRVAAREVLITFFIKPQNSAAPSSCYHTDQLLYHNAYSKPELEQFVLSHPKVSKMQWEEVDAKEIILHIYLIQPDNNSDPLPGNT